MQYLIHTLCLETVTSKRGSDSVTSHLTGIIKVQWLNHWRWVMSTQSNCVMTFVALNHSMFSVTVPDNKTLMFVILFKLVNCTWFLSWVHIMVGTYCA